MQNQPTHLRISQPLSLKPILNILFSLLVDILRVSLPEFRIVHCLHHSYILILVKLLDWRGVITLTPCNRNPIENRVVAQLFWKFPTFNLTQ